MDLHHRILAGLIGIAYSLSLAYVGGPTNLELILASALLVGGCCYKLIRALYGHEIGWSRVHWFLIGYLVLLVVLGYTSTFSENSIHFGWLLASFALVFMLAADLDRGSWLTAFTFVCITGVVSAFWGIGEFLNTGGRASGPIVDPSTWGAFNNLFFFGVVAVFLTTRKYPWLGAIALFIFAAAVFSAYSRVGNVVFLAALTFTMLLCLRYKALRARLVTVVGIAVVSFALVNSYASLSEASGHDEGYAIDIEQYGWNQRLAMWRASLGIYREYPVFGSGPGTFKLHYPRYRTADDMKNYGNFVHNDYIQFLQEGGPLLLGFLVLFAGTLVVGLARDGTALAKGDAHRLERVLLAVAMGTALVQALMNFPLYQLQVQLLLGLLFARYVQASGAVERMSVSSRRGGWAASGIAIVALLALAIPTLDEVSSEIVNEQYRLPLVEGLAEDSETYVSTMSMLSALRSGNSTNRFAMATIYRTSFDLQRDPNARRSLGIASAFEYQAGIELNRWQPRIRHFFAQFLRENPWLMEVEGIERRPEELYRKGVEVYPVYIESHMALADYLAETGRGDEAYRVLTEDALPWANLRHGSYRSFYANRLALYKTVLRQAIQRGDRDTLERLLAVIQI